MDSSLRSDDYLEHAMDTWGALVYRLALNQTRSKSDADDVTQDVFLSLLKDSTEFHDDEHLKAWLIHVTVNRCHALRRSAWSRRVETADSSSPAFSNLQAPAQKLFTSDVWEAVQRLPQTMRLVVHLHYFEGYSIDEISHMAQIKPSTVKTRLHRARKKLKLDLEQEAEHEKDEHGRLLLADE